MQDQGPARARAPRHDQPRKRSAGRIFGVGLALAGVLLLLNGQVARAQVDEEPPPTSEDTIPPDDTTPPDETVPDDTTPPDETVPDDTTPPDETAPDDTTPPDDTIPVDDPGTDPGATTTTAAPTTTTAAPTTTATTSAAVVSAASLSDPANGTFTLAALPVAAAVTTSEGSTQVAGVVATQVRSTATPLPTTGRNSRGQAALGLSALSAGLIVVGLTRRRALSEAPVGD
jgi:LPXTG-motif cell wall-anchored protein